MIFSADAYVTSDHGLNGSAWTRGAASAARHTGSAHLNWASLPESGNAHAV